MSNTENQLTGRAARCVYYKWCKNEAPSNFIGASGYGLPFFVFNETKEFDSYYCGCRGWD